MNELNPHELNPNPYAPGVVQKKEIPATFLSVCALFAVQLGTLIGFYMLYLLLSKKGTMVFSPEYKEIIAQTPHMKYKTSPVVWIALGLIVAVIVSMIFVS